MRGRVLSFAQAVQDARLHALFDRDGDLTTCATWARIWHEAFGRADDLLVATDGVALPLTFERRLGVRVLRSFTNGHSQRSLTGTPGEGDAVALLRVLVQRGEWEMLHLQGLAPSWSAAFTGASRELGLVAASEHRANRLMANLACDPESYLATRSRSTFGRKAKLQRAFLKDCDAEFREDDPVLCLDEYLAAERRSWKSAGGELLSATPRIEGFYRQMVRSEFADHGKPWMVSIRERDRMVAGAIYLRGQHHAVGLKAFYDLDYAKYSLGFLLLRFAIERMIAQGCRGRVDFYSDAPAYAPFATESRAYDDLVVWAGTPRARAARLTRQLLHHRRRGRSPEVSALG